jgi:hypothetical protein
MTKNKRQISNQITSPSGIWIILSIPRGPSEVRTNSAIALALAMLARRMSVARELMFFESWVSFLPALVAAPEEDAAADDILFLKQQSRLQQLRQPRFCWGAGAGRACSGCRLPPPHTLHRGTQRMQTTRPRHPQRGLRGERHSRKYVGVWNGVVS